MLLRSFGACGPFYVTQKAQISQKAACGLALLRRFQACGLLWIISRNTLSRYTATNEDTSPILYADVISSEAEGSKASTAT